MTEQSDLGIQQREFEGLKRKPLEARKALEGFDTPKDVEHVTMTADEGTSLCPITGQPDMWSIEITYSPNALCLESKSLKLYIQAMRNEGAFIEDISSEFAHAVFDVLQPKWVSVKATQRPRGGVGIMAQSFLEQKSEGR